MRGIRWICWQYSSVVSPWCAAADCTTPFGISLWSKIKEYWIATSSFRAALGTWMNLWRPRKLLHWNSWAKYELTNNKCQMIFRQMNLSRVTNLFGRIEWHWELIWQVLVPPRLNQRACSGVLYRWQLINLLALEVWMTCLIMGLRTLPRYFSYRSFIRESWRLSLSPNLNLLRARSSNSTQLRWNSLTKSR